MNANRLRSLVRYDPETGKFFALTRRGPRGPGDEMGSLANTGYWTIRLDGKLYLAHRLAWLYVTGRWPKFQIDHYDRNKENNRWGNLREATPQQNSTNNYDARPNSKTGRIGVCFFKGKYQAQIMVNGRAIYLGRFATADEASAAYDEAKKIHHPFGGSR